MRRIARTVIVPVALAVVIAPGTVAASSPERATGSGHIAEGPRRTFAFAAVQRSDGTVSGQAQLDARGFPARVHMRVTCLRIEGDIAYVSGVNTNADPDFFEGVWAIFAVQDNGEGGGSPPDRVTEFHPAQVQGPTACLTESPSDFMEIGQGNVQVG
ncbi:MAG: hypothetical protein ACRDKA_08045 [Actinomycetota bacterium]